MNQAQPYLIVNMQLAQIQKLSPTMTRFTFQGDQLDQVLTYAPDQRVKLFFPIIDNPEQTQWIENHAEWYQHYRQLPEQLRPPMRTYTIRHLRPQQNKWISILPCMVRQGLHLRGQNRQRLVTIYKWLLPMRIGRVIKQDLNGNRHNPRVKFY